MSQKTKQPKYRQNTCTLVIGRRGCGKSSFLLKLLRAYQKKTKKPVVIYDVEDNDVYEGIPYIKKEYIPALKKGVYRCIDRDSKGFIEIARWQFRKMLLICEDAYKYLYDDYMVAIDMITACKQRNVDLIFTFHSFSDTRPKFLRHTNILTMFKTGENWKQIKSRISSAHLVEPVFEQVNKHKSKYYQKSVRIN